MSQLIVYEAQGTTSRADEQRAAWRDLQRAFSLWPLCVEYALADLRLRYRRTKLGPFWNGVAGLLMSTLTAVVLSHAFKFTLVDYLPYVAISFVLWGTIGVILTDGPDIMIRAGTMIRAVHLPISFVALRSITLHGAVFAHDLLILLLLLVALGKLPLWAPLLVTPALLLWAVMSFSISLALGILGARYRDLIRIAVGLATQTLFFVTPVLWFTSQLGDKAWLQNFNPVFVMIEIIRQPLLGQVPSLTVWLSALLWTALMAATSWILFVRTRRHVAVWC